MAGNPGIASTALPEDCARHFPQETASIALKKRRAMSTIPKLGESDGRLIRGERTKRQIIEAFILVLRERQRIPTVAQIAERAGYSVRTLYLHFADVAALSVAACDYAIERGLAVPVGNKTQEDRDARIRFQVEVRAHNCEEWTALWRMLLHYQGMSPELARRVTLARRLVYERMQLMYQPELSLLSESDRHATLLALEALTDYESWNRMREEHGLPFEEACEVWRIVIDRMLPSTPPA
jgi:AcrR family transcriptional regulator